MASLARARLVWSLGVRNFFEVFHEDMVAQRLWAIYLCFPRPLAGVWMGSGAAGLEPVRVWNAGITEEDQHALLPCWPHVSVLSQRFSHWGPLEAFGITRSLHPLVVVFLHMFSWTLFKLKKQRKRSAINKTIGCIDFFWHMFGVACSFLCPCFHEEGKVGWANVHLCVCVFACLRVPGCCFGLLSILIKCVKCMWSLVVRCRSHFQGFKFRWPWFCLEKSSLISLFIVHFSCWFFSYRLYSTLFLNLSQLAWPGLSLDNSVNSFWFYSQLNLSLC